MSRTDRPDDVRESQPTTQTGDGAPTSETTDQRPGGDVLERNLQELLTRAHEPPAMSPEARARVLEHLRQKTRTNLPAAAGDAGSASSARWTRWFTGWRLGVAGVAVAAAAVALFVALRADAPANPAARHDNAGFAPERVALADGTEILLDSGAKLTVTGPRRARLESGRAFLDVAKNPHQPFILDAPHGRVVVLGTRFAVSAEPEKTVASVVRGVVRIENQGGQATLHAGDQGVLAPGKEPETRRAPRLSHLLAWTELARRRDEKPAAEPMRKGALIARNPQWQVADYPLPVRDFSLDVHVERGVARVAVDQTFFNAQRMELEGVYRFPLPTGAAISRLAMYVDGERMEAAVVERTRARGIYESIVYRRRDPALLEWMSGNEFKMRVYPLPARTEKRIALAYTQVLPQLYDDTRLEVPIPELDAPAGRVRFRVRLVDCADCQVRSTSHALEEARDGTDKVLTFERTSYDLGDDLILFIRDPRTTGGSAEVAHMRTSYNDYWHVRATPDLGTQAGRSAPAAKPRAWVILCDTSASQSPAERRAQSYLIERLLGELDEDDLVDILAFDATVRPWASSLVRVGDLDRVAAARFLADESTDGVGWTDLSQAVDQALGLLGTVPAEPSYAPHILYVGNGMVTADPLGEAADPAATAALGDGPSAARIAAQALIEQLRGKAVFVAAALGSPTDESLLRRLAETTGGMVAAMNPGDDLSWRAFDLIAALRTPRALALEATFLDAQGAPVTDITAHLASRALADGEPVDLITRRPIDSRQNAPAVLELRGTTEDGAPQVLRIAMTGPDARVHERAGYVPRLFAMRHVDALLSVPPGTGGDDGERDRKAEITRLGRAYFLMTPYTSLLVLENDEMYERYGVARKRTPDWAEYQLPERIPVVYEPAGTASELAAISRDAVLARTPLALLQNPYGMGYLSWDANMQLAGGLLGAESRGMGTGFGTIGAGSATRGFGSSAGPIATARSTSSTRGRDAVPDDSTSADSDNAHATTPREASAANDPLEPMTEAQVTSAEVRAGELEFGGTIGLRRSGAAVTGALSRGFQQDPGWGLGHGYGRGGGGFAYNYYYNAGAPMPAALHYDSDPRLDDLTEHVPGLFRDDLDDDLDDRRTAARTRGLGSISDEARDLVERARAKALAGSPRYLGPGGARLSLNQDGRLALERVLPTGLEERVVSTSDSLYHVYPELGLATRRPARDAQAVVLDHLAPFVLAAPDQLALFYTVFTRDPHTLELRSPAVPADGAKDPDTAADLVIALDDDLRVVEIRAPGVDGDRVRRVRYQGDRVAVDDGQLTGQIPVEWQRLPAAAAAPASDFDPAAFTVVDMPLRQPARYAEAGQPGPDQDLAAWRQLQVQLLASHAALGQSDALWRVLSDIRKNAGPPTLGELTLASGGVHQAKDRAEVQRLLSDASGDASSPAAQEMARYLAACHQFRRSYSADAFAALLPGKAQGSGQASTPGLVQTLARYRVALSTAQRSSSKASQDKVIAFIEAHPDTPLSYILGYTFASRWQWDARDRAVAVWDALARGPWSDIARFEAARALSYGGRYDQAAERYEELFSRPADVRVDSQVSSAFLSSSRGQAGWQRFWIAWRDRVLASDDPARIADLLYAALATGQYDDLDRAVARATKLTVATAGDAEILSDALVAAGRDTAAQAVLQPWLDPDHAPTDRELGAALCIKAAHIAERQGRFLDAAELAERAVELAQALPLAELRAHYVWLLGLYGKEAQARGGAERDRVVARALAQLADWRALDPDNADIDRSAAQLLYAMDEPERAWRYLSTAIERHPMEGASYQTVAEVLEAQGKTERAERLWRRAAEVDPTDPTWLLRRAQALSAMGRPDQARGVLSRITTRSWHERFWNIEDQARRLAKDIERARAK